MPKLEQKLSITDMVYFANFIQHVDALRRKNMIDSQNWQQIIKTISTAQRASMHCSIATVDQLGQPNITPIGTVFLKNNQTGFSLILIVNHLKKTFRTIAKHVYKQ